MQVDGILASKGREVRTIQPDATIGEAIGRLCAERVGALVVSEDGRRIAGIISDRGITWTIAERGAGVVKERVRTVMTERVITCRAGDTVGKLMAIMTERRIRHIPVVDAAGALSAHHQHRRCGQASARRARGGVGCYAGVYQRQPIGGPAVVQTS